MSRSACRKTSLNPLAGQWGNVSRHVLETIAAEGFIFGALTEGQVRRLLGLESAV